MTAGSGRTTNTNYIEHKSHIITALWFDTGKLHFPRPIRELRELNRTRRKLEGMMSSEKNRIQKVLEDANIKPASVVSKIDGVSSMTMIQALLDKDSLSKE